MIFATERAVENQKKLTALFPIHREDLLGFFREAKLPSISNFTAQRHYYVALKQLKNKQEDLSLLFFLAYFGRQ